MKCAIFHAQNLCSLPRKNFACFAFSANLVRYIIVWQNPDVKLKDGTKSSGKKVLIDGQQRITAMAAAIVGQEVLDDHYKWKRISMRLNLDFEEQMNALADRDKLTPKAYREENR